MLERAEKSATVATTRFGASASAAFAHIELAGKRLAQTGRILLYNFTLPIVAAFGYLTKQSLDLSAKIALLSQVYSTASGAALTLGQTTGQVARDLNTLQKITVALSNGFGIAQTAVYDMEITFGRAGLAGVALAKSTETALTLITAFQVTTEEASGAVLTLAVNYHLTANQTLAATAILAYAAQQTRADLGTLTAAFVKAAPAAQQLGIDVAHLAALIAVMQQAGFKGAESGTALNFAMTRLLNPTPQAVTLFKSFGVNLASAGYQTRNATSRIEFLAGALSKLNSVQQQQAIAVLIGARQNAKMTTVFRDLTSQTSLYASLLAHTSNATKLQAWLDNQLALAMDNNATKFKILKTQITNNFLAIANYLTPALLTVTSVVKDLSQKFAELGNTASGRSKQALIVAAFAFLALIGPIAIVISSLETMIGTVGRFVTALRFLVPLLMSPWAIVIAGIAGLVYVAIRFRDGFIAVLKSMYDGVLAVAQAIYTALQWINPFARHSPSLVEQTESGVKAMVASWQGLKPILTLMDTAAAAVRRYEGATTKAGKALALPAVKNANAALAKTLPIIAAMWMRQSKVVAAAKAPLDAITASLKKAKNEVNSMTSVRGALQDQLSNIGDPQALQSQADALSEMARKVNEAGDSGLAQRFQNDANSMAAQASKASGIQDQIDALTTRIDAERVSIAKMTVTRDALNATYDEENKKLKALAAGYANVKAQIVGLNTAASGGKKSSAAGAVSGRLAAFNAAAGAGNIAVSGAGALPGIKGIQKDATTLDAYLADLNTRQAARMKQLFGNPFGQVQNWFKGAENAISQGKSFLSAAWDKVTSGVTSTGGAFATRVGHEVHDAATAAADALLKIGKSVAAFFKNAMPGIKDLALGIGTFLAAAFHLVGDTLKGLLPLLAALAKVVTSLFSGLGSDVASTLGQIVSVAAHLLSDLFGLASKVLSALAPVLSVVLSGLTGIATVLNNGWVKGLVIALAVGKAFALFGASVKLFAVQKLWMIGEALAGMVLSGLSGFARLGAVLRGIPGAARTALGSLSAISAVKIGLVAVAAAAFEIWQNLDRIKQSAKSYVQGIKDANPVQQGNIDSLDRQRTALRQVTDHYYALAKGNQTWGAAAKGSLDLLGITNSDVINNTVKYKDLSHQLNDTAVQYYAWQKTLQDAAPALGLSYDQTKALAAAAGVDLSGSLDTVIRKLTIFAGAAGLGVGTLPQLGADIAKLADPASNAADKVNALTDALDVMAGSLGSVSAAQDSFARAMNDLGTSLQQNGTAIDGNSIKALNNRDAFRAVKDRVYDVMKAQAQHGATLAQLRGTYDHAIAQIDAMAKKYGLSHTQVDLLLTRIGLSRSDFDTFAKNVSKLTHPLDAFNSKLSTSVGLLSDMTSLVSSLANNTSQGPVGYLLDTMLNTANHPVKPPKKHAMGGIFNTPTLGIIGERGPEMVVPLSALNNPLIAQMRLMSNRLSMFDSAIRASHTSTARIASAVAHATARQSATPVAQNIHHGNNIEKVEVILPPGTGASPTAIATHLAWALRT